MKRLVPLFILLCVVACTSDHENGGAPQSEPAGQTGDGIDRGTVIVKFKEDPGQVSLTRTRSGETTTGIEAIDPIMTRSGAYEMTRTFPYVEKLEKATRSMGMHLWYTISFDESYPVTRAISELGELEIFDHIEPSYQIQRVDNSPMIELSPKEAASLIGTRQGDDATAMPFDDEYLPMQWHYNNDGKTATNSRAGADIRVFGAWTYTDDSGADGYVGDPSVIVAVNDGGVDYTHPDLAGNMWTNENSGQDDDQWNGDLHGWNFANNTSRINFDNHGTHVAGTVAAVNNNGIGVSGVAGGDFKKGRVGARIITCQIFGTRGDASESRLADAFRYAAYRGAVISQNSWGYRGSSVTPNVILDGIDFFITFAGTNFDPDNLQQAEGSPMKGGIVFFSAGNNNTAREQAPANYAKVHAVTAFGPDYQKAYYSNMGAWVDITAPGGDGVITSNPITDRMVLSTTPGGNYGWNMGTSMSTPHVSGVAALVLSKTTES